jgi:hypothetical protein
MLALVVASLTLGLILFWIFFAMAPFLPGFVEDQRWIFRWLYGIEEVPRIFEDPRFGLFAALGCSPFMVLPFGAVAALLWRSAGRLREAERDRLRQLSGWSTTALLYWFDTLLKGAAESEAALREAIEGARRMVQPHLIDPQRRCLELALERLSPGSGTASAPIHAGERTRRWLPVLVNLLLVAAPALVGLAALTAAGLLALERYPILGIPLSPSAAFLGSTPWLTGAVVAACVAFGFRRLDARATVLEREAETASRSAMVRLFEGFLASLQRMGTPPEMAAEPRAHRVASGLASALLAATTGADRRRLLNALYASGYLRAPRPLDLRGTVLGALDLSEADWPGIQLSGTKLEGASFRGARFEGAGLANCSLRGASLQRACCARAVLAGSDLRGALAQRADFSHADLSGCDLIFARLWAADLRSADLRQARLDRRQLAGVVATRGALGLSAILSGPVEGSAEGGARTAAEPPLYLPSYAGWSHRLEVWALVAFHGGVFFAAGIGWALCLYFGYEAGWVPPPQDPDEQFLSSLAGLTLVTGPFHLAAAALLALAWRLWRLSERGTAPAPSAQAALETPQGLAATRLQHG